jgi:hypothetical protein
VELPDSFSEKCIDCLNRLIGASSRGRTRQAPAAAEQRLLTQSSTDLCNMGVFESHLIAGWHCDPIDVFGTLTICM